MITKKRAIDEMLRWLDEASINGETPASAHLADYRDRAAHLLSGVVSLLAEQFRIPKTFTVVQNPVPNLLGDTYTAESVLPGHPFRADVNNMRSFYIETAGDVEVTVTCGNDVLFRQRQYSEGEFVPLRSVLPVDTGKRCRLSVSSEYPASVRYAAAYDVPFRYDDDVQPNTPYAAYDLPPDLREYDKCIRSADGSTYEEFHDVLREGFRTFLLPRNAKGQFEFHYWRNPCAVPPDALDDTPLEVAPEAEALVGLKLAADLTRGVPEDQSKSYWLDAEFSARIANLERQERGGIQRVQSVYHVE